MYSLFWRSPALPYTQKQIAISVPAGSVVSNAASLRFTGKGATNYGKIQQENLLRLLENFAGPTEPDYATVGQTWYDTTMGILKVCVSTSPDPLVWQQMNATQITVPAAPPPASPSLGDTWFSQTGTSSGILYAYTGVGRYPQVDWNATTSGYWPPLSTTAAIILNAASFGAANTNYSEAYIHGFSAGVPANVQGSILVNGVVTLMPLGFVATDSPVKDGLIVWDQTVTMISQTSPAYFAVRQFSDGRWFYDNNGGMVEFVPVAGMYAVGRLTSNSRDVGSPGVPPGVVQGEIWSSAVPLMDIMQVVQTKSAAACGGWEQIWPQVETYGGRREYDYMYGQLASLIGDPLCYGGNDAEGRSIQNLTDFKILDASYQQAWAARIPLDPNVATTAIGRNNLRVDPNSNDWDLLLSAMRYAVSRLELPAGFLNDLSPFPFVQDGRIIPSYLHALPGSDVRRPPVERYMKERVGAITITSAYQETVNVLRAAVQNRYVARGLLQGSGVGNTFTPTYGTTTYAALSAAASSFSGTVIHGMQFVFTSDSMNAERFFYSTGALEVVMTHAPAGGGVGNDLSLKAITDNFGRIRVTADNTYVMTPSPTPTLAQVPSGIGYRNLPTSGVVLATLTSGTSTIVIRGTLVDAFSVRISLEITAGAATSGTFSVNWSYLADNETYANPGPVRVYPAPLTYQPAYVSGSTLFLSGVPAPAPPPPPPPVTAPTISLNPNGGVPVQATATNIAFTVGTYTGTVTSATLVQGPGAINNYTFSGGVITYDNPVYLGDNEPIIITVTNSGGSATGTGNFQVTPGPFNVSATGISFVSGTTIPFAFPRPSVLLCTNQPNNRITNGSQVSGTIPPGTTLQFNQGGNGDVILTGTPTTPGTYNYAVQVFDAGVSTTSTLTVNLTTVIA